MWISWRRAASRSSASLALNASTPAWRCNAAELAQALRGLEYAHRRQQLARSAFRTSSIRAASSNPRRYHSIMVNSGVVPAAPARRRENTLQIWKMSPLPAANRRFIAYSGEGQRYPPPGMPAILVAKDSICGSLTAAALNVGRLDLPGTRRDLKNSRAAIQHFRTPPSRKHSWPSGARSLQRP